MSVGDYAWEKFYLAVLGMATSKVAPWERLTNAYVYHLMHAEHNGLPEDIQEDFAVLSTAVRSALQFGEEGQAAASARAMEELEVLRLIESIVSMYDRVAKYGPHGT
jgi:hypothetical protein